jgi:hypothetical protein
MNTFELCASEFVVYKGATCALQILQLQVLQEEFQTKNLHFRRESSVKKVTNSFLSYI